MKLIVVMLIIILVALWVLMTYNKFMKLKNTLETTWQTIDAQLKLRYSLLPVYVELSKAYIHDHALIATIMELRSTSMGATSIPEKAIAEAELYQTLKNLHMLVEHNKVLSSDADIIALHAELAAIETTLQQAIHTHNDAAAHFNVLVESFPTKLIASLAHFETVAYF